MFNYFMLFVFNFTLFFFCQPKVFLGNIQFLILYSIPNIQRCVSYFSCFEEENSLVALSLQIWFILITNKVAFGKHNSALIVIELLIYENDYKTLH